MATKLSEGTGITSATSSAAENTPLQPASQTPDQNNSRSSPQYGSTTSTDSHRSVVSQRRTSSSKSSTDKKLSFIGNCMAQCLKVFLYLFYTMCVITGQYCMIPSTSSQSDASSANPPALEASTGSARVVHAPTCKFVFRLLALGFALLGVIVFLPVNVISLGFDIYIVVWCPFQSCGYISIISTVNFTNITGNGTSNNSRLFSPNPESLTMYYDWQKALFTVASFAGTVSYIFMICILFWQYGVKECADKLKNHRGNDATKVTVINPFYDSDTDRASSKLSSKQLFYFLSILGVNMLIFVGNIVVFFIIFAQRIDTIEKISEIIDTTGLLSQFCSQFCAILSCFIFSKVAYSVCNRSLYETVDQFLEVDICPGSQQWTTCTQNLHQRGYITQELNEQLRTVQQGNRPSCRSPASPSRQNSIAAPQDIVVVQADPSPEPTQALQNTCSTVTASVNSQYEQSWNLLVLKDVGRHYSKIIKHTLRPYGTWFTLHWILYTLTAFMSIAYVAEAVILELYGPESADKKCHAERHVGCRLTLAYQFLFCINHIILFLYPCFRAASISAARNKLIRKVSEYNWNHLSPQEQGLFIQFLKDQDLTFRVSFFCARLSFGFNIAYLSIFIGILGVVLKLSV